MRKRWTNRKLFSVTFKGREPRALLWRKPVYKEWFLYAKLAQELGKKIPKAFGDLRQVDDFEDWWRDPRYGFELFCEKPTGDLVTEETGKRSKLEPDEIMIKVNLKGDLEVINRDIRKLLISKDVGEDYTSNARFYPSRPMKHIAVGITDKEYDKGVKRENKLEKFRKTYLLSQTMSPKEIVGELGLMPYSKEEFMKSAGDAQGGLLVYQRTLDNRVKTVKRHIEGVEKTFKNMARGTFP